MARLVSAATVTASKEVRVFADHCVFMRSIYLHGRELYELSAPEDRDHMWRVAPIFFGDLNRMFREYMIQQICKITDPAQSGRKNSNLTIEYLTHHYGPLVDAVERERLTALGAEIQAFRAKLLPARNKLISHLDSDAVHADESLGAAPQDDWDQFWLNLQDVVNIFYRAVVGEKLYINGVAMLSDVHGLLRALRQAR